MKINWKQRFKNKTFVISLISLAFLLIVKVAGIFGISLDLSGLEADIKELVELIFIVLGVLGVTVDPTTPGVNDSELAMTYGRDRE